jgi:thiamine kinase-like enzyme
MQVEPVVDQIWPGGATSVERLGGGITNHNFKVVADGEAYVLRIGGKDTELLGIDRTVECQASVAAGSVGVGPEVVHFIEPEGYLVTRFVDGRPVPPDEMRRPENIRRVAASLRRFHEGLPLRGVFDSFRIVEDYRGTALARGGQVPDVYDWAHEQARAIELARGPQPERPCHNDLLNANFIDDGDRLWIVDWEYAGMGDVFFDLANFSVNHELSQEDDEVLLEAYFGRVRDGDLASLRVMRFMSDFREAMWGVVQQAISELDFDFVGYADEHFERLRRTASTAGFAGALRSLGGSR